MKIVKTVTHAPELLNASPLVHIVPEQKQIPKKPIGLGDVVEMVAGPIASAVDKLTGSKLAKCPPCMARKNRFNQIMPNISKPFASK